MRKLFLLILLFTLALAPCASARMTSVMVGGGVAASALNDTNQSRGFEAATPAGWSDEDDNDKLNEVSTAQYYAGAKSMEVELNDAATYQMYDIGATKAALSMSTWFRTPTFGATDFSQTIVAIGTANTGMASGTLGVRVYVYAVSSQGQIKARGSGFGSAVNVDAETWYRIEVQYVKSDTTQVDVYNTGGTLVGSSDVTGNAADVRYMYFGVDAAAEAIRGKKVYFDNIGIDWTDSTFPLAPFTVDN